MDIATVASFGKCGRQVTKQVTRIQIIYIEVVFNLSNCVGGSVNRSQIYLLCKPSTGCWLSRTIATADFKSAGKRSWPVCKLTLGVLVVTMEHSGFSPPEDHDSSMEHYTEGELGDVPAVSTVVRISRGNQRGGQRARTTHRIQPYADTPQPNQSSSSDGFPTPGPQLTAQQATFLAGAAVAQANQASQVASHAANAAEFYQREAMQVREVAQAEIINARQTIHSIVAQAKAFVAEREGSLGQVVLEAQAQAVQVTEDQAMQAISAFRMKPIV